MLNSSVRRLFGLAETPDAVVVPAVRLEAPEARADLVAQLRDGHRVFLYFDEKLGGEISIPGTARSPEFSFDVTIIEVELLHGLPSVGRFGILEIQTMDFHGSYGRAVRNLKDALRMFPDSFGLTVQENPRLLSEGVEGPNIANVFKRTFYQMMFKFQLGLSELCAGCVLAIPQSVWDSWKPHLGDPALEQTDDGVVRLFRPDYSHPTHVPAWVYIFDLNADSLQNPSPIEIKTIIATDAASFSYYALDAAPAAALNNIASPIGMMPLLARRLSKLWPELAGTVVTESSDVSEPRRSRGKLTRK